MIIFADAPVWVGVTSAIGTFIAGIAAAVAAFFAWRTTQQNRVMADATTKSAAATEKAAEANARTADLMQQQLEQQREERIAAERHRRRTVLLIFQDEVKENIARCEDEQRLSEPLSLSEWGRFAEDLAGISEDIFVAAQASITFVEQVNREAENVRLGSVYETIQNANLGWVKNHKREALKVLGTLNGKISMVLDAGVRDVQGNGQ